MKILVSGGAGYKESVLVPDLPNKCREVIVVDNYIPTTVIDELLYVYKYFKRCQ